SFLRSGLSVREQAAVAWFGPKGFASVVYGLIVLASGIAAAQDVFQLVAVTIVLSILLHSSTDIVIARGFDDDREVPAWFGIARRLHRRSHGGSTS
ncbi:cation:proton antiporter, partial [Nonomuraea sp. 10N515B]